MHKLMMAGIGAALVSAVAYGDWLICSGESKPVHVNSSLPSTVDKSLTIHAAAWGGVGESVTVAVDGTCLFSTTNQTETAWLWQPLAKGNHTLTCTFGANVYTQEVDVTALDFFVQPVPNPPTAKDDGLSITPTTRNFGVNGGGNAIITSGSGTWTASVSDPWITLNAESGNVGYPVAYVVSANTNVEQRTGYVYVSGWTHTVTQDGVGGSIAPGNATHEHQGGSGTVAVAAANKMAWQARPNVDWLSVSPTSGAGEGAVTYQVAPYNEVATRQGTLTIAGNTFTVFQYGRRMKLESANVEYNYETHVIPVTVNALAMTQWSVTPNNSWISIVDAGNGQGGDLVTIAIAENPSYRARTGTVKIGTEKFTVTQQGRPAEALSFNVSPAASTASVEGANGLIAVTATPDLPWTAASGANWITVLSATASGAGNGNVVYAASPNPTLFERTGTVTVTPEEASGVPGKTHAVTQPAALSALSSNGYEFEAAGESYAVEVSVADIVEWTVGNTNDWITVNGSASRVGPGTVTLQAEANDTVYPRSGTVTIAGKAFSVSQKARNVELEYETKLFDTDGGYESISIHPDGNSDWTAVASDPTWITIFQGDSGTGDGEILYIVAPYNGDGGARTGWIEVGDKKVYITQRAYDLSIEPNGSLVTWNNGVGEFGVSASIGDVWTAIATEPWITLVSGYDEGTGSGVVRFAYADNNTGKMRSGKIIVNGEVYTLEQRARQFVAITAAAERGGHVDGGGSYDLGAQVTLTAVPDSGYAFAYWTGDVSSMQNPLEFTADVAKSVTAVFEPLPIAFASVVGDTNGVSLAWNNLAWAVTYRIYRGVTSVPSSATVLAELVNDGTCAYLDKTGDMDVAYWYWIEAEGVSDEVMSDPMTGKKQRPRFKVTFGKNGGTGGDDYVTATYGKAMPTPRTAPTKPGYVFDGYWNTTKEGGRQYYDANMKSVSVWDRTSEATLWAKWRQAAVVKVTFGKNGGSGGDNYVTCTEGLPMPTPRTAPKRSGYIFEGYWTTTGANGVQYYDGDMKSAHAWDKSGNVTLWAKWRKAAVVKVTLGKNGGTGGDNYVTCTEGQPMPTPRTAPKRAGWTFAGYWNTLAQDANGNPTGKQYYDANMKSVRNFDKSAEVTLWAKWTVRVKLGKNGGTGGDDYVTVTYNQPFPKRTMPKRTGYAFGGYWMSASSRTGQCYNADGTGTSSMKWTTGGTPTVWALWTSGKSAKKASAPADTNASESCEGDNPQPPPPDAVTPWPAGLYTGVVSGGAGWFTLQLDGTAPDGSRTAFLVMETESGIVSVECEAEVAGDVLLLVDEDGTSYRFEWDGGLGEAALPTMRFFKVESALP